MYGSSIYDLQGLGANGTLKQGWPYWIKRSYEFYPFLLYSGLSLGGDGTVYVGGFRDTDGDGKVPNVLAKNRDSTPVGMSCLESYEGPANPKTGTFRPPIPLN